MREILALIVLIVAAVSIPAMAVPIQHPDCIDALEQVEVLRMRVPVYIDEDRFHRSITAGERRLELARLTKIVQSSCEKREAKEKRHLEKLGKAYEDGCNNESQQPCGDTFSVFPRDSKIVTYIREAIKMSPASGGLFSIDAVL
jgi:hypothetical protein